KLGQPFVDQVETNVYGSIAGIILRGRTPGEIDSTACDPLFRQVNTFRDPLDDVTVPIACCTVHFAVRSPRIFAQDRLHNAHRLDEGPPVGRSKKSEAADAIAD